jgi:hypothetical protein
MALGRWARRSRRRRLPRGQGRSRRRGPDVRPGSC